MRGISQYKLLKDYHFSAGQLNRLRNNHNVNTYTIDQLCKILDCKIEDVAIYLDKFSKEPYPFREGKASVAKREGGVVMIDKTGTVISPEFKDIRNFYLGYAYAQCNGKSCMDIVDENFNVVRSQLDNKRLDPVRRNGEPIEFINGYSTWPAFFHFISHKSVHPN